MVEVLFGPGCREVPHEERSEDGKVEEFTARPKAKLRITRRDLKPLTSSSSTAAPSVSYDPTTQLPVGRKHKPHPRSSHVHSSPKP